MTRRFSNFSDSPESLNLFNLKFAGFGTAVADGLRVGGVDLVYYEVLVACT